MRKTPTVRQAGATKHLGHLCGEREVMGAVPRLVQMKSLVKRLITKLGQDRHSPAQERRSALVGDRRSREVPVSVVKIVHRQTQTLQLSAQRSLCPVGRLAAGSFPHWPPETPPPWPSRPTIPRQESTPADMQTPLRNKGFDSGPSVHRNQERGRHGTPPGQRPC